MELLPNIDFETPLWTPSACLVLVTSYDNDNGLLRCSLCLLDPEIFEFGTTLFVFISQARPRVNAH